MRVLVTGSGVLGLVTARYLRKGGHEVTIVTWISSDSSGAAVGSAGRHASPNTSSPPMTVAVGRISRMAAGSTARMSSLRATKSAS